MLLQLDLAIVGQHEVHAAVAIVKAAIRLNVRTAKKKSPVHKEIRRCKEKAGESISIRADESRITSQCLKNTFAYLNKNKACGCACFASLRPWGLMACHIFTPKVQGRWPMVWFDPSLDTPFTISDSSCSALERRKDRKPQLSMVRTRKLEAASKQPTRLGRETQMKWCWCLASSALDGRRDT